MGELTKKFGSGETENLKTLKIQKKMGLNIFLRFVRLFQILFAAIVSLCLATSFLKVAGNDEVSKVASPPTVQCTGIVSLLFGLTCLAEFFMELSFIRKPTQFGSHCVMSHAISLGMGFFSQHFRNCFDNGLCTCDCKSN